MRYSDLRGLAIATASGALATLALALPGCGGDPDQLPVAKVSGTLSVDGKPVNKGTVFFTPLNKKGRPATGAVTDGKFTLSTYSENDGAVIGKHRVAVDVSEEVPTKDGDTTSKSLVPKKVTSPDTSGIELEIPSAGRPNLQIDVLTAGGAKVKEE